LDYYNGDQLSSLEENLKVQVDSGQDMGLQLEFVNVVKLIVDRLSVLYRQGALRKLVRNGWAKKDKGNYQIEENEQSLFNYIVETSGWATVMDRVNTLVNLTGSAFVRPRMEHDGVDSRIVLDIVTADELSLLSDEGRRILLLFFIRGLVVEVVDRVCFIIGTGSFSGVLIFRARVMMVFGITGRILMVLYHSGVLLMVCLTRIIYRIMAAIY
jgi:hypothetical protein